MSTTAGTIPPPGSVATIVGGFIGATIGGMIAILVGVLITFPAMLLAVIVAVGVIGFFGGEGPFSVLLIVVSAGFLWLARALTMMGRCRPTISEIEEE